MNILKVFILGFVIIFISFSSFTIYNKYFNNAILEDEVFNHLESIAYSKSNRISSFLDERKNDLVYLSSEPDIINLYSTNGNSLNSNLIEKLEFYKSTNDYLDLILMDIDGKVLWSSKNILEQGTDLNLPEFNSTKYGEIFHKVKHDFGVGIFDPGYYGDEDFLSVFVTTPILVNSKTIADKKDMLGIIALQIDNKQINEKIVNNNLDNNFTNIYLVNRDGTPITDLSSNGDKVTQIDTEMYNDCFKSYNNYYQKLYGRKYVEIKKSGIYENYVGDYVFGAHHYILQTGLCVMVEVNKNKFYSSEPIQKQLFFTFFLTTILCIFIVFTSIKYLKISRGIQK